MNQTVETILKRRSMRAFKPEQISDSELDTIIECGLSAPSGMNVQNWHFTVVQNGELMKRMNEEIKKVLPQAARERYVQRHNGDENFSIFYNAPTLVYVSGVNGDGGSSTNCALAAENMCIAAESMDVGSCILGLAALLFDTANTEDYLRELGIPQGYRPLYAIALGYKNMVMSKPQRLPGKVNYIK